ncbi:MAG: type II secretion system protein I [Lysobacterales bacterium]|jgi:type II secretion system protein I
MILETGNKIARDFLIVQSSHNRLTNQKGFTLIELLLTLAILTASIVTIFQSFIISLDRMRHLTHRIYATTILDNQLSEIEKTLRVYKALPFELNHSEVVEIGGKVIQYKQNMNLKALEEFVDIFQLDLKLTWDEQGHNKSLSRSAYISDFQYYHQ